MTTKQERIEELNAAYRFWSARAEEAERRNEPLRVLTTLTGKAAKARRKLEKARGNN